MGVGKKYDFDPLLPPGRHVMSLAEIKDRCVNAFPLNLRRREIWHRLEEFIQLWLVSGICCEVWLDGSFLTAKPEPDDLDVTAILDADVFEVLSPEQVELFEASANGTAMEGVDSFAFVRLGREHPFYRDNDLDPAYSWGAQYGLECGEEWLKGFAVIRLRETDVGLRICS